MIMKYPCHCLASQFLKSHSVLREVITQLDKFSHKEFGRAVVVTHIARDWGTMNDLYPGFFEKKGRHPRSSHLEYRTPEDEAKKQNKRKVMAADLRSWIFNEFQIGLMQKMVKTGFGPMATLSFHKKPVLHLHLEVKPDAKSFEPEAPGC